MSHLSLPLVLALFALLAGLLPGLRLGGPAPVLALASAAVVAGIALAPRLRGRGLSPRRAHLGLGAALVLAGAGLGAGARADAAADCRARLEDGARVTLRGVLGANRMVPRDPAARTPLLPLEVERAEANGRPLAHCGVEVRVRLPRETPPLPAGTVLELHGEWRKMPEPVVPSAWPRDPAWAGSVWVKRIDGAAPPRLSRDPLLVMRGRVEGAVHRLFPRHGPLADALLLGRRETLDRNLSDRFARSGLVHLLAISGTHVALIGAVLVLLGRVCRVPRRAIPWTAIALVALYLLVIGAPASAVRSGVMLALALLAVALQRPSSTLATVSAAALAILAWEPMGVLDIGAQLSFAGVLGIVLLRAAMLRRLPESWSEGTARRWVSESLVVSVAAFLCTAPVVAHHFGQVAPVSIAANLPAIPLASLALVGAGAAVAAEPVSAELARLLADGTGVALDLLERVVDVALMVPGGHAAVSRPQWPLWAAAGVVFLAVLDVAGKMQPRVRWAVAALAACAAFVGLPAAAIPAGSSLELVFLDVGQGDAILLRTPADRWVLVDAGERGRGWDAGERRVVPYLRARGVSRLEAMVLTHPHGDHVGGAPAVMRAVAVGRVVDPGLPYPNTFYLETLREAGARGVPWSGARAGRSLRLDGVTLELLWPGAPDAMLDDVDDANHISAVIRVRYGSFSALLTGDAGEEVERELVRRHGAGLRAQVLKAGHHGSRTSTSEGFVEAVRPALAVVSAGVRNEYGHPHAEVVRRLERRGVEVARTDRDGTVVVRAGADGRWEREEP